MRCELPESEPGDRRGTRHRPGNRRPACGNGSRVIYTDVDERRRAAAARSAEGAKAFGSTSPAR